MVFQGGAMSEFDEYDEAINCFNKSNELEAKYNKPKFLKRQISYVIGLR